MSLDAFLVVSLAARGLARAATRAGRPVLGIDAYADQDSRSLAQAWARVPLACAWEFDDLALLRAADELCPPKRCLGLVYGSGFESRPDLLGRLAAQRPLWGNDPEVLARCADPIRFFALLDNLGIPHPLVQTTPPRRRAGWLAKQAGGCGGLHVGPAESATEQPGRYFQRQVQGQVCSLLFLADGRDMRPVGFNQALPAPPEAPSPWAYAGTSRLADCPAGRGEAVLEAARTLTRHLGLRGLNGIDFMVGSRNWKLLELNPRPTASLELWDVAPMPPLFDLHVQACQGHLPTTMVLPTGSMASAVVYAGAPLTVPRDFHWPGWCADLTAPGTPVPAHAPLCTVLAVGGDAEGAAQRAGELGREVLKRMSPTHPARQSRPSPSPAWRPALVAGG